MSIETDEKEGVIVLLDRLGTKGIWKNNPKEVINKWKSQVGDLKNLVKTMDVPFQYKVITFSDTILITATGKSKEDLLIDVAKICSSLLISGLGNGIFFRGGMTYGKFYDPDEMILGEAIDELAQYYTLSEWIGISVAPQAHRILDKMEQANRSKLDLIFYRYDIPLKNSIERRGWAINWVPVAERNIARLTKTNYEKFCNNTLEYIDYQLEKANDISVSFKWRNTQNFVLKILDKTTAPKV